MMKDLKHVVTKFKKIKIIKLNAKQKIKLNVNNLNEIKNNNKSSQIIN